MKLSDLVRSGELDDYIGESPGGAAEIDRPIAEDGTCECGGGREYRPFMRYHSRGGSGYSYRAFAVCTVCGEAVEF